jgi:hypothetical protein
MRLGQAAGPREHAPGNALSDPDEVARFYDRCSDLMRELLDGLSEAPGEPRPFPQIEDAIGWPRRRIASVLGGVCHLRHMEFAGKRPYRFLDTRESASGRWEMWMDAEQARAVWAARRSGPDPT